MLMHQPLRTKAVTDAAVKAEFDKLSDKFTQFDEFMRSIRQKITSSCSRPAPSPGIAWHNPIRCHTKR